MPRGASKEKGISRQVATTENATRKDVMKLINLIPRLYWRISYREYGVLIHREINEIGFSDCIDSVEIVWMTPRKYNLLSEFDGV